MNTWILWLFGIGILAFPLFVLYAKWSEDYRYHCEDRIGFSFVAMLIGLVMTGCLAGGMILMFVKLLML